jgi:hypothetical protein
VEYLRVTKDQWGQEVLQGVSWDLLGVFFGIAVAFIAGHALFAWLMMRKRRKSGPLD